MGLRRLVLGGVSVGLVGFAVAVVDAFTSEQSAKPNPDALVADGYRIATDAQAWVMEPVASGGGGGRPVTATLEALGYRVRDGVYTTRNGTYTLSATATALTIRGTNTAEDAHPAYEHLVIAVHGPTSECVQVVVSARPLEPPAKQPMLCTPALDW